MSGNNEVGCTVLIDGQPINDGCISTDENVPTVLSGLRIIWGRDSTIDQPTASSCTFEVLDPATGDRLIPSLTIGRTVDVRVDTVIYPDPDVSTIPAMVPSSVQAAAVTSSTATATTLVADGSGRTAGVIYPPRAYSSNPFDWDGVPRSLPGQAWEYRITVTLPAGFLNGWDGWAAETAWVGFTDPTGASPVFGPWTRTDGAVSVRFTPPAGLWLGVAVRFIPNGPRWDELDTTTWAGMGTGSPPLTNLALNPAPGTAFWWGSNVGTSWEHTYANGEILVNRLPAADADPNIAVSCSATGAIANWTLPAGVNYQRAVEVWVDAPATVVQRFGPAYGFTGGQALPANQWTRIVQQFTGTGAETYPTLLEVQMPGVGPGVHAKMRHGQLVANPGGQTVPYFDGSTPDTPAIDYAWTGPANASTSTATDRRTAWTWAAVSTIVMTGLEMLAPAAGAAESVLVFSGRITDVIAKWDGYDDPRVQIIAQDWLAELANRFVGDDPWPLESLNTRAHRVVSLSQQPVSLGVDAGVQNLPITYRDVDRQAATALLQQLAQSAGGILWTATHLVTGQVMRIEDVGARKAALTLEDDPLPVHIIPSAAALANALPLSACNFDVDPVRFNLDMTDTVSMVAIQWMDQTVNNEGHLAPTQRSFEVVDPGVVAVIGARRMSMSTQLAVEADAQHLANTWLARSSVLAWRIEGLNWDTTGDLGPVDIDAVIRLLDGTQRNGLPVALVDLPDWVIPMVGGHEVALYIEGGTYSYDAGSWVLELNTLSANGSAVGNFPYSGGTRVDVARYGFADLAGSVRRGVPGCLTEEDERVPEQNFPNADLGDDVDESSGVVIGGPLNEEMQQAYDAMVAARTKPAARAGAVSTVTGAAECAETSGFATSDLATCSQCGHYSAMCRVGSPCQLCQLQQQINDIKAAP